MVMNTGGGLTKCIHVGQNILYDLAYIPKPPPIFRLIQHCGNIRWEEMVRTYNCGIGFVVIGSPVDNVLQNAIEQVARKSAVAAYFLGTCWESSDKKNHVRIHVMGETFEDPHQI
jgi:phosphoribosylaminoimidazole (AIR) synthetase